MNTLRISGIASGMDTETMVKDLMRAERMRLDKFTQSKQLTQWRQEQYNDVNKDFANFIIDMRKELELTTSTSTGVTLANSTSNLGWVKKAISSDEDVFSATATSSAMSGTHKIKVVSLAEGVNIASKNEVKTLTDTKADSSSLLYELGVRGSATLQFEVSVGGSPEQLTINYDSDSTIEELIQEINNATSSDGKKQLQASFDNTTGRLFLSTKGTGSEAQIKVTKDSVTIEDKDGVEIPGAGLFTGVGNVFNLNNTSETPLLSIVAEETEQPDGWIKGNDAEIEFDGAVGLTYSSNNIMINGIQLDLKAVSATEMNLRVDTDVDGVYDKVKTFVDKYNELIDKMNGIVSQKKYRDYPPLTDEQKESLSEDEIKKWTEMAQSGLLKNDEFITKTLDTMRNGLYKKVDVIEGKFNQITNIGITTAEWKDKGKLVIDDTKLKKAIAEDVDGVINLLFKESSITGSDSSLTAEQKENKRNESGLVNRLFNDIVYGMKDIITKSGTGDNSNLYRSIQSNILIDFVTNMGSISNLDKDLMNVEKTLMREEDNLERKEDSYWRKFTAMEKALQRMNSQSSWLMQQFGGQ